MVDHFDEGLLDEVDTLVLYEEGDLGFSLVARVGGELRAIALWPPNAVPVSLLDHLMKVSEIDCVSVLATRSPGD